MGQKANPISLRLKTTNKTFASCWYSEFYYSDLITQELKTRQYLSKLFAQLKYPNPCLSISFLPKKTKTLAIYLNPFQSRRRGCERFQLRSIPEAGSFDPSIIFTRKNDSMTASTLTTKINKGSSMAPPSMAAPLMAEFSWATPGHQKSTFKATYERKENVAIKLLRRSKENPVFGIPGICNTSCKQSLGEKYKKSFVQKLLLLMAVHKVMRKELICKKNHQFFQKLHYMIWFQGREENRFLLSSKQLGISVSRALPPTSLSIGSHYKVAYSNAGLSFAEKWSRCNEKEIEGRPQLTKEGSLMRLERWKLKTNEFTASIATGDPQVVSLANYQAIPKRGFFSLCAETTGWANSLSFSASPLQLKKGRMFPTNSLLPGNIDFQPSRWPCSAYAEHWVAHEPLPIEIKSHVRVLCTMKNESISSLSYQLTNRRKDQIHISHLESIISKSLSSRTTLYLYKSVNETQAAHFVSSEIAYYLERRVPFRRIKQLLLRELQVCYIKGVRVICSGRVGGRSKKAQRAREERFQWGQTSSHVFFSKLSFASRSALTPFGKVGIRVWICYK